jgi:hypothetical protein
VKTQLSSFVRGLIGFVVCGAVAATSASFILVAFFPIPPGESAFPNYGSPTVVLFGLMTFFCGAFIGRRGFTADAPACLLRPIIVSYIFLALMFAHSGALTDAAGFICFASVGIVASVAISIAVMRWIPYKRLHDAA